MKLTVVGIAAVIATVALLAFVAHHILQAGNGNQHGNDDQPINPS